MPHGVDSVITHSTVDRVLLAVWTGADTVDYLMPRTSASPNAVLRSVAILVKEGFVVKVGPRHALKFRVTDAGALAARRLRRGGERKEDVTSTPKRKY